MSYYRPYKSSSNNIKVELDLAKLLIQLNWLMLLNMNQFKKAVYNAKVTSIEGQIAELTKNTIDNLADITKLKQLILIVLF